MRILAIVLGIMLISSYAYADPRGRGGGMSRGGDRGLGHVQHQRQNWNIGRSGGYGQRRGGYGRGYNDFGGAIVGGVIGGIFGNWLNPVEPQVIVVPQEREVPELACEQKYRSFVRQTGTYTGFDGLQHAAVGCQ